MPPAERDATDRPFEGRVAFVVGTGRCGTHFLQRLLRLEPGVAASHERGPLNETFHRYCKWYGLPVDDAGFLAAKEREIAADLADHRLSVESSAYLSLSIRELHEHFRAKFVLLLRRPEAVVNSYLRKGREEGSSWYAEPFVWGDPTRALGYQPCAEFHYFLGRIAPRGAAFEGWNRLTRVGKLAWYWSALNARVLEQLAELPESHWRVQKIEELDEPGWRRLAAFLGLEPTLPPGRYAKLSEARPGALDEVPTVAGWTPREGKEFEAQVSGLAARLGYEHRVERLAAATASRRRRRPGLRVRANQWLERLRLGAIRALGGRA